MPVSEDTRLKRSESMKRYWNNVSPKVKAKQVAGLIRPETILKRADTLRSRYDNEPEFREKMIQALVIPLQDSAVRKRATESLRKRWQYDRERLYKMIVVPLHSLEIERKRLEALGRFQDRLGYKEFRAEIVRRSEVRKKISKTLTGKKQSEETRQKKSLAMKGKLFTEEHKQKIRHSQKKFWSRLSKEEVQVRVKNSCGSDCAILNSRKSNGQRPSRPESVVIEFLESHYPSDWVYNGYGNNGIIIGRRIPDFVNINGKKLVIEVFGEYWHNPEKFSDAWSESDAIAHYKKWGFNCLVLWEKEVYDKNCLENKVANFIKLCKGSQ